MISETPETDAALRAIYYGGSANSFPAHARAMEFQRNQWRRCAAQLADVLRALGETGSVSEFERMEFQARLQEETTKRKEKP